LNVSFWPALAAALLTYGVACAALWKFQTRLIFYPLRRLSDSPSAYGVAFSDVQIRISSGFLHGWWMSGNSEAPVMLYLHGNGGNVGAYASHGARLRSLGYSVLIIDYRGYGQSSGPFPAESRVYEDAEGAWNWLVREQKVSPRRIFIYGHSLGGAVAIELAGRHPDAVGLIVESSFTSALALGNHMQVFRIFPVSALLQHHFNSIAKVPALRMPVLFLHGTRDLTVPSRMSRELYAAAADPKELVIFPSAMHMNCAETAPDLYQTAVTGFVERACVRSAEPARRLAVPIQPPILNAANSAPDRPFDE
jgi:uncharacterized protein